MLSSIGLAILGLGWAVQLYYVTKKQKNIQPAFVGIYGMGVVFLVIDGFQTGLNTLAWLNSAILVLVVLILIVLKKTKHS